MRLEDADNPSQKACRDSKNCRALDHSHRQRVMKIRASFRAARWDCKCTRGAMPRRI